MNLNFIFGIAAHIKGSVGHYSGVGAAPSKDKALVQASHPVPRVHIPIHRENSAKRVDRWTDGQMD